MRVTIAFVVMALTACGAGEPVSRTVGARCDLASQCDERCLIGGDFPGGFCSITCDSSAACPDGTACADDQGGVCLFTCSSDANCTFLGAGWTCKSIGGHPQGQVMACRGG